MKKPNRIISKYLMFCMVFFTFYQAQAQYTYSLTTINQPYTNLSNATVISPANWSFFFDGEIPIGFTFPFFNQSFNDNILVDLGELSLGIIENANYFIYPFNNMDMESYDSGLSPISYLVTGSSGNKILKIEWQNASFPNSNPVEIINVQAWLYENGTIEFHYGFNTVSNVNMENTQIGLIKIDQFNPEILHLSGSPTTPSLTNDIVFLSSVPPNGTVYKFTKTTTGLENIIADKNIYVSPNPTKGKISINGNKINSIEVYNLLGEIIYSQLIYSSSNLSIDLSSQPNGFYFIKVKSSDCAFTQKILKQ